MLALFAFGQSLPRLPLRILKSPAEASSMRAVHPDGRLDEPVFRAVVPVAPVPGSPTPVDWPSLLFYAYCTVALAFLVRFVTGIVLIRKLLQSAPPIPCETLDCVYESE